MSKLNVEEVPIVRTCAYEKCSNAFYTGGDAHAFHCSAQCLHKDAQKWCTFDNEDEDHDVVCEYPIIPPLPPLLSEGSVVCFICSSKLPRSNEEWWQLVNVGGKIGEVHLCIKCATREKSK